MKLGIVRSLYKKEMLDILRDKKTVLMMIVVPLILYPLLFFGAMYLTSMVITADTREEYTIGLDADTGADQLQQVFMRYAGERDYHLRYETTGVSATASGASGEAVGASTTSSGASGEAVGTSISEAAASGAAIGVSGADPAEAGTDQEAADAESADLAGVEAALREGVADVYVLRSISDNRPYYRVAYLASENDSTTAAGIVRELLGDYREELREEAFAAQGLDQDALLSPIAYVSVDLATDEENAGNLFGLILPFLLITSILMGALYPAIDATAGEKERGTLETLLTLPVNNLEMIGAKFLATSTVAVSAAVLNLISMSVMGFYFYSTVELVGEPTQIRLWSYAPSLLVLLLCMVVFAMFAAAACLSSCIYAKSFKEAQNYTTPVMLLFMIGGMAGMIPALRLTTTTALLPVVNVALLIAEVFKLHFDLSLIALVLFSNIAYTALAVVLMTRLFSSENVLFGDAASGVRILESRRMMEAGQTPGMGDVVLLFALLLLTVLFAGSLAVVRFGVGGLMLEQGLILGITLLYAWYIKADLGGLFSLRLPRARAVPGALLSWAGMYLLMLLFSALLAQLFPSLVESADNGLVDLLEGAPTWLMLLSAALFPAVCEECAFRGFLLGTLQRRYRPIVAVIATGLIFGLYHLSLAQFLVVGALGVLLSYVVWREQSILLSILMHFCNNAVALLVSRYPEAVERIAPALVREDLGFGSVIAVFGIGCIMLAAGIAVLRSGRGVAAADRIEKE